MDQSFFDLEVEEDFELLLLELDLVSSLSFLSICGDFSFFCGSESIFLEETFDLAEVLSVLCASERDTGSVFWTFL